MTKRILILMSKTGGGHRASAQALQASFEQQFPGLFDITVIDLLMDYLPWPVREAPRSYDFISSKTPWLWRLLYEASDEAIRALDSTAGRAFSHSVERAFKTHQPDLVISVHPLAQHVSIRALRRLKMDIPFITVITDLATMHPAWFHRDATLCFVPTEEAQAIALEHKLSKNQVRHLGLPVRPVFANLPAKNAALRIRLGMDEQLPAVLLYGGGARASRLRSLVEALDSALAGRREPIGQIIVVTGKEGSLQPALATSRWQTPLRALGFVNNMHEWMTASSCMVAKAGPGTIAEALICGLPMMLSGYIPGQEAGNVPYVIDHGVGAYSSDPRTIASTVAYWLGEGADERRAMSERAQQLGNPKATENIVKEIAVLLSAD